MVFKERLPTFVVGNYAITAKGRQSFSALCLFICSKHNAKIRRNIVISKLIRRKIVKKNLIMAYSTINERFKIIADKLFGGNITAMSKGTFISRTTLNSIVGEKGVSPGYDIIRRIAEMSSPKISLDWLILGVGDMLEEEKNVSAAAQNNTNSNIGNQVNDGAVIIRLLAQLEEKDRQIAARDGQITNLIELLKK